MSEELAQPYFFEIDLTDQRYGALAERLQRRLARQIRAAIREAYSDVAE